MVYDSNSVEKSYFLNESSLRLQRSPLSEKPYLCIYDILKASWKNSEIRIKHRMQYKSTMLYRTVVIEYIHYQHSVIPTLQRRILIDINQMNLKRLQPTQHQNQPYLGSWWLTQHWDYRWWWGTGVSHPASKDNENHTSWICSPTRTGNHEQLCSYNHSMVNSLIDLYIYIMIQNTAHISHMYEQVNRAIRSKLV